MAKTTQIAWAKSTFNCWIGCTKIGPGCDLCYADALDNARLSKTLGGGTKEIPIRHFGIGAPRYRTSTKNWNEPKRWNRQAPDTEFAGRAGFWPVFCASLGDVFDNEVQQVWREDLWELIYETPNLSWLIVTKRIGNVAKMVPERWMREGFPPHVRLIITVVNEEEADRDIPKLLALNCKNGVSYEPALGAVDWTQWMRGEGAVCATTYRDSDGVVRCDLTGERCSGIDWIIVGGESDQGGALARTFDIAWARNTIQQCKAGGVPVFVKQLGSIPHCEGLWSNFVSDDGKNRRWQMNYWRPDGLGDTCVIQDRAGADPAEWPADLRVQQFPC